MARITLLVILSCAVGCSAIQSQPYRSTALDRGRIERSGLKCFRVFHGDGSVTVCHEMTGLMFAERKHLDECPCGMRDIKARKKWY